MITARLSPRPARSIASASPSISAVEHGVPASRTAGPAPHSARSPSGPSASTTIASARTSTSPCARTQTLPTYPPGTAGCLTRERVADRADARDTPVAVAQSFEGLERNATRLVTPTIRNVAPDQGGRLGPGRLPPVFRALVPGGDRLDDGADVAAAVEQGLGVADRRPPVPLPERVPALLPVRQELVDGGVHRLQAGVFGDHPGERENPAGTEQVPPPGHRGSGVGQQVHHERRQHRVKARWAERWLRGVNVQENHVGQALGQGGLPGAGEHGPGEIDAGDPAARGDRAGRGDRDGPGAAAGVEDAHAGGEPGEGKQAGGDRLVPGGAAGVPPRGQCGVRAGHAGAQVAAGHVTAR